MFSLLGLGSGSIRILYAHTDSLARRLSFTYRYPAPQGHGDSPIKLSDPPRPTPTRTRKVTLTHTSTVLHGQRKLAEHHAASQDSARSTRSRSALPLVRADPLAPRPPPAGVADTVDIRDSSVNFRLRLLQPSFWSRKSGTTPSLCSQSRSQSRNPYASLIFLTSLTEGRRAQRVDCRCLSSHPTILQGNVREMCSIRISNLIS